VRPCYRGRSVAIAVDGVVHPRFRLVRDALAENLARCGEIGAACALCVDGELVVDIHGGLADVETATPWREDTVALAFGASKVVTAACVLMLADRGAIALDAPVARYWPEFAAEEKDAITVRSVLSHRSALAAVDGALTLDDGLAWDPVVDAIAAQPPNWRPGPWHAYHVRSFGWILGEVVRRVTGRSIGRFLAEEVAGPLGLDLWIGLPESVEQRAARPVFPRILDPTHQAMMAVATRRGSFCRRALLGPADAFAYDVVWRRRDLRAAEIPSSNCMGSARSLALLLAALIGAPGLPALLSLETLRDAVRVHAEGFDRVLLGDATFGLGFVLPPTLDPALPAGCFGASHGGGPLLVADPSARWTLAYLPTRLGGTDTSREQNVLRAVQRCIAP